jgi:type IV secretory pathway TrbF-like protein
MGFKSLALILGFILALSFAPGCASNISANKYKRSDVGALTRVEPAQVLSQRLVHISKKRRGLNYVVKLDRTGETLSITQGDDVLIAKGSQAWVEFGDRIRLIPKI